MLLFFLTTILSVGHASLSYNHSISLTDHVETFASRTYFYIGGQYVNATLPGFNTGQYMRGQIYVEHLSPQTIIRQHPIVFITGNGQTGTNWLNTPDGHEGWASYFLRQGYEIFITDMAQRGRSPYLPGDGSLNLFSTSTVETTFTAPQDVRPLPYPQAYLHTQWPGTGHAGDPVFDAFYASQVQLQSNTTKQALYNNASYVALLDKIATPVFVITHSQSGLYGWQLGDARPNLVRGIIAVEPQGPPFENWEGPPFSPGFGTLGGSRPYGLTGLPLHYDPSIGDDAGSLQIQNVTAANANVSACLLQKEPAKRLVNLGKVPVLMYTGEGSYHRVYDYCTVKYLKQAGVDVEYVQLGEVGIHGNGHFSFLEKNNLNIAEQIVLPFMTNMGHTNATC